MKETVERNSSIAWFKLSELIRRGERERALCVLRLLSHSIKDKAFVALLEAELLHMLHDKRAKAACLTAISLYEKDGQYDALLQVYYLWFEWWPDDAVAAHACMQICKQIVQTQSTWQSGVRLTLRWLIFLQDWDEVDLLEEVFSKSSQSIIYKKIALIEISQASRYLVDIPEMFFDWAKDIASHYLFQASWEETQTLTQFLACVASGSTEIHECLCRELAT